MAPPKSTYGAVNYSMHLNQASQMEISSRVTPLFELLGKTWQAQDEASRFNEGWNAANRHWACVIPSNCCSLLKNLLQNQGGSSVVSATRKGWNKHSDFYPFCISQEGIFNTERHVRKKWTHSSTFPLQVDVGWSHRNNSNEEVGTLRSAICPDVSRRLSRAYGPCSLLQWG